MNPPAPSTDPSKLEAMQAAVRAELDAARRALEEAHVGLERSYLNPLANVRYETARCELRDCLANAEEWCAL